MAAQHSIRSMVEGMAMGMPVTQVLGQQINHLSYAATGPGGLSGAFKQAGSAVLSLLSPTTLVVAGLAAVGVAGGLAYASVVKSSLAFDDVSKSIGTTIGYLHGLESAAAFKGIDQVEFFKAMGKFGGDVYLAQNRMGALAETFRANNLQAKDFNDYLEKAADLIKNASTDQQRLQLLQQMGLPPTMEWVRFLSQGKEGIRAAAAEAAKFGETAEGQMIAKARAFDDSWNRAIKNFSNGWRNAVLESGSWLQGLSDKGVALLMKIPGIGAAVPTNLLRNALNDSAAGYSVGSKLTASSAVDDFYKGTGAGAGADGNGSKLKTAAERQKEISDKQTYLSLLGQTATAEQAALSVQLAANAAFLSTGVSVGRAKIDQIKRLALEQANGVSAIKASVDAEKVNIATVGMSAGSLAEYTAVQNALNAAKQKGQVLSSESIAAIRAEGSALGQAAAQADLMKSAYSGLLQGPLQSFRSAISQGATFFEALKKSGVSALDALSTKLMDMAAQNLWKAAFGGGTGGGILSAFGLGGGGIVSNGGIVLGGASGPGQFAGVNHSGMGPGDSFPSRSVASSIFLTAPRFHSGIGPGERAAIIRTDESVLTPGQMRQLSPNGGAVHVTTGDTHIHIDGNADDKTIALMRQELATRDAQFASNVVATVKRAQAGRHL
jgi:hypothetical protein